MQNLRDKLLQAGLVTPEQAEQSKKAKPPARNAPRPAERKAPIPKLPPLPGSREYQRLESRKQVERDRQIRETVARSEVPLEPGPRTFHFVTRKGRLRRLELSLAQAQALEEGRLAVVERPEPGQIEHSLVPAEIAEQLSGLSPKAVRFFNKEGAPVGFLTDAELEAKKQAEAALPPEGDPPA